MKFESCICSTYDGPDANGYLPDGSVPLPDGSVPEPDAGSRDAGEDPCRGRCAADEECNVQLDPPLCESVCTHTAAGCPSGTYCDPVSKQCKASTGCVPAQCEPGQGCYDPASIVAGQLEAGDVCTCYPALVSTASGQQVQNDSCASLGKVCDVADFNHPTPTACRMPRQFEYCVKSVGCEGGAAGQLECVASPFNGDAGKNRCFTKCAKTQDCPDPEMKCWPNNSQYPAALRLHCFYNYCGQTTTGETDPTQYYSACAATSNSDGQCMPYNLSDGTSMGMCRQTGTVASGQECDPNAVRPNTATMCPAGEYCEAVQPGTATGTVRGICRTLCNAAPAGTARAPNLNCVTGKICTDETMMMPSYRSGDALASDARVGLCRTSCALLGTTNNCGRDILNNNQGCYYNYGTGGQTGVCRPMQPGASNSGGTCSGLTAEDMRFDCADRLLCFIGGDDTCHKFCDVTLCPDETAVCSRCDSGQHCQKEQDGQNTATNKLGFCTE